MALAWIQITRVFERKPEAKAKWSVTPVCALLNSPGCGEYGVPIPIWMMENLAMN